MNLESFNTGSSPLHHLDARTKLLSCFVLALVVALCHSYEPVMLGLLVGICLILIGKLSPVGVAKRLLLVNGFTLFLCLALPLTYPGEALYSYGLFSVSREGVLVAGLIALKTNTIVLLCIGLLSTSGMADIGRGLERLKMPRKLCWLLLFSYRYIHVIYQEFQRLRRAAMVRCFVPSSTIHTYRTFGYLFGMTLVKSWQRAERVNKAMLLRGFHGKFYSLHESRVGAADYFAGLTFFLFAGGIVFLELI